MVVSSLHRHSKDSSSWFFSSLTTQSCIMASVNILSLKSSPMNLMLPMERRRALSFASSSSSWSLSRSVAWGEPRKHETEIALGSVSKNLLQDLSQEFHRPHTDAAESSSFCFLSNTTSSTLSFSNSFWQRFSSSLRKFTVLVGLSITGTLSCTQIAEKEDIIRNYEDKWWTKPLKMFDEQWLGCGHNPRKRLHKAYLLLMFPHVDYFMCLHAIYTVSVTHVSSLLLPRSLLTVSSLEKCIFYE